jgi:RES domain-containing protein
MYKYKVPRTPFAHPDSDRLLKGIREVSTLASSWKGDVYRVTTVERANEEDLTSGEGGRIWGGRWNPPGLFRTVYCSLDYATAMEEFLAGNRRSGLPDIYSTPSVTTGSASFWTECWISR